jgi:hypothetical protein
MAKYDELPACEASYDFFWEKSVDLIFVNPGEI